MSIETLLFILMILIPAFIFINQNFIFGWGNNLSRKENLKKLFKETIIDLIFLVIFYVVILFPIYLLISS